ncbi:MAG: hydrogenase subunit [Candidatus Altiarchaeota archaeon]|nr:hydrogenase subunit [Candidatus Altiarchaeota archaeon]
MTSVPVEGAIEVLLALVLVTGAFIVTRRDLLSLVSTYATQSLLLALLALSLYLGQGGRLLLYLAVLTFASKVVAIPYVIRRVQRKISIRRDIEFHYIGPVGSIFVTLVLVLIVYGSFSVILREFSLSNLFYLGAVFGISLSLMGMMVTFSRTKIVTKILGYLMIENGVLLFSIFLIELPFIIEVLVMIDLIMLVLLAAVLAIGIDSSIEEFQNRLRRLGVLFREDD